MKTNYIFSIGIVLLFFIAPSFAQSPGLIVRPAGGNGVTPLNPNGDGFASQTTSGFTTSDITQSEVPFKKIPPAIFEPTGDLATGPSGGFTDIVRTFDSSGFYVYYDGTNIMFRLRIGGIVNGSKGYSVLIDTDNKMGNSGPYADPGYVAPTSSGSGNPGFEYEVVLRTNFDVTVYNVNGVQNPVSVATYSLNTNSQISVALTRDGNNADYFYDWYVPLSAIGTPSSLRMAATTVISPNSALQGSRSDIYGTDDESADGWTKVIEAQCGYTVTSVGGSTPCAPCTAAPTLATPITIGSNISVSGSWISMDVSKPSKASIFLYKNGIQVGFVDSIPTGTTWNITVASISIGDVFYAKAQANGESLCLESSSVTAGCASYPSTPVLSCASTKGITGTVSAGTTSVLIYLLPTTSASPTSNQVSTSGNTTVSGTSFWHVSNGCSGGNVLTTGTYMMIASNGSCNSAPAFECITSGASSTVGLSINALTLTTPIYPFHTIINGSGSASGNVLRLFINGVCISSISATGATFSFSGLTLKSGDVIKIYLQSGTTCMTVSNPFTVGCYTQPPVIFPSSGTTISTSATSISGTTAYPGASVSLYRGTSPSGTLVGSVTATSSGAWSISPLTLIAAENYYATQTANGCISASSSSVGVLAATTVCPTISNSYLENDGSVTGTLPVSFSGKIRLYEDGFLIDSVTVSGATTWSIPVNTNNNNKLYPGGVLTATTQATGAAEKNDCAGSATVSCAPPTTPSVTPASRTIVDGQSTSFDLTTSQSNILYLLESAGGTSYTTSQFGSGAGLTMNTTTFNAPGTYNLTVKGISLSGSSCESSAAVTVIVSNALPASFINISVRKMNECYKIAWGVEDEQNVSRYEVERGNNCSQYEKIGSVAYKLNSAGVNQYSFNDHQMASGIVCYRMKQIDVNGSYQYSEIIRMVGNEKVRPHLSPNPAREYAAVHFNSVCEEKVVIQLIEMKGKLMQEKQIAVQEGNNIIKLNNLDAFSKGIYVIRLITSKSTHYFKLIRY